MGTMTVRIAKWMMRRWERFPQEPAEDVGECQEIFKHPKFMYGTDAARRDLMRKSAEAKYRSELDYPWDHYFGIDLRPLLAGAIALDLGCFTGGRSVAWAERYGFKRLVGVDVAEVFVGAAREFASSHGVEADFRVGVGEALPVDDDSVDAVLSFDVLEHVQNVPRTLAECYRVLKPGGRFFLVFPSYFHPLEHHLALVTRCPGIQYFFAGDTLVRAYCEIIEERGSAAEWYKRSRPMLEPWERGNTINGTTLARFRRYLRELPWEVVHRSRLPIGSIGRQARGSRVLRGMAAACRPLARVPGLEEIFLHRVTYILRKPENHRAGR